MSDDLAARARFTRAYGADLADCFGLPEPPTHVQQTLRHGLLAVSELRLDRPPPEPTAQLSYDDAFLVTLQLRNIVDHEYWLNGRALAVEPIGAGKTYIHDLRQDPRALVREPAHALHFYMSLATLNAFAEQEDAPAVGDLLFTPGAGVEDPVLRQIGLAVLAAFAAPHSTTGLFLDQVLNAVCAHTLGRYGNSGSAAPHATGGLAQWQLRRATDMMDARMDVSLSELAQECRLSVTHFTRVFRRSTGMSPHQWLLTRRVSKARSLLADSTLTLAEIALACGFSSQSHFNRAFAANIGTTPGRWRRSRDCSVRE